MQIGCIIQARTTSTRLPNKVNADIGGWPMWRHVFERMKPFNPIMAWATDYPHLDEMDVLSRYVECTRVNGLDVIIRVTGDCPLIDPHICQEVLDALLTGGYEYAANDWLGLTKYPDGMGCEVFRRSMLEYAQKYADKEKDKKFLREHVTPWMKLESKNFRTVHVPCPNPNIQGLKFSVDTREDLELIREIDARLPEGDQKYRLDTTLRVYEAVLAQRSEQSLCKR